MFFFTAWNCRAYCLRTVPTLLGKSAWTADVRLALLGMSLKRVLELNSHTLMRDTVSLAVHLVQHFESQVRIQVPISESTHNLINIVAGQRGYIFSLTTRVGRMLRASVESITYR